MLWVYDLLLKVAKRVWVPDKVQECISRANLLYLLLLGKLILGSFSRVNNEHHDDPDEHSNHGSGGVVDHRPHTHFT